MQTIDITLPTHTCRMSIEPGLLSRLGSITSDVAPHDPPTLVAVSLLLAAITLLGCYLPARRATRLDPTVALRHE